MKNKFQSLSLELFQNNVIVEPKLVYGGAATEAPNGGCTCTTAGGSIHNAGTYTSDTQSYNSNGTLNTTDYQGWVAAS